MLKKDKIWVIAYVNRKMVETVKTDLIENDFRGVEAYIPTVRVLRKNFKGKKLFEFVPLLFNYGFFKMDYENACNQEYLMGLRHAVNCIYGWVKDPAKLSGETDSSGLNYNNDNFISALPKAAMATDKEVSNLVRSSNSLSIFNKDDLGQFKKGDYIKLEGYPFDGMEAEIMSINFKKEEIKVRLLIDSLFKQVTVSFENVFYSIYKDYSENFRESSTDEIKERGGPNAVDHIIFKNKMK